MSDVNVNYAAQPMAGVTLASAEPYALYDVGSVTLATFLGTPLAGAWLMAYNYRRLGAKGLSAMALAAGFAVTTVAILLGFAVPKGVTYPLGLVLLLAMRMIAGSLQGPTIAHHVSLGGQLKSKWTAAGVGLLFFVLILAVVCVPVYLSMTKSKVIVGTKDEVFYTGMASKEDAERMGAELVKAGYFKDRGTSVFLDKDKDGATISLVQKEGVWNEPGMLFQAEEVARIVAPAIGGFPVRVKLIDSDENVKKQGMVGREAVGKDEVYYFGSATQAQAAALGEKLRDDQYFTGRGTTVLLSKDDGPAVLSFVVADGYWNDPAHVDGFAAVTRGVAGAVGGLPVTMRLVNTGLEMQREVVVK